MNHDFKLKTSNYVILISISILMNKQNVKHENRVK